MLDRIHPWGRKIQPFCPEGIVAQVATESWQTEAHFRIREEIFVREQHVFSDTDRDEYDTHALPIVALCPIGGVGVDVVGVVRIYAEGDGVWYGGRLGVSASHRRVGAVGTALITCAVSTAHKAGCTRFFATIQRQNVKYFERHHFSVVDAIEVQGRPHALMEAHLESYPPELANGPVPTRGARQHRAA